MKEDKEIIEEIWEKEPCQNPIEPAQWVWMWKSVRGLKRLVLRCANSVWWNHHK